MTFQLPAVPACRILAKADIPHDNQIRYGFFDGTNGTLHGARHIPGGGSLVIFVFRQAKDLYRRDTELVYFFCQVIYRLLPQAKMIRRVQGYRAAPLILFESSS
ncbi:Uncharacterised protein [Bacteroides xylanisolvens]|nr:Uncharacterised protein [Bacteroides xylanisolvens]